MELNATAIIDSLRAASVREMWLDSIDKARRKYMNIKVDYNKFAALDSLHTGGNVRSGFSMEEMVEQLANTNNPIARPPVIVVDGEIIVDATYPANAQQQLVNKQGYLVINGNLLQRKPPAAQTSHQIPPAPATFENPILLNRSTRGNRGP